MNWLHIFLRYFATVDPAARFAVSHWQHILKPNKYYFFYRCGIFATYLGIFALSHVKLVEFSAQNHHISFWLKNVLYFAYGLGVLQSLLIAIHVAISLFYWNELPAILCVLYWFPYVLSVDYILTFCTMYWIVSFEPEKSGFTVYHAVFVIFPPLVTLTDLVVVGHEHQPLHFLYSVALLVVYTMLYDVVYVALVDRNKYKDSYKMAMMRYFGSNGFIMFYHLVCWRFSKEKSVIKIPPRDPADIAYEQHRRRTDEFI